MASGETTGVHRSGSFSQISETSQTAQDYIASQLSLEADAREVLPFQFDTCTKPLGPLRQSVYACLTCTPPPASKHQQFTPAGVCYSCSISCHGEHNLVELFTKRGFECDCGTTRMSNSGTPCSVRPNAETGRKGDVKGEEAHKGNKYNHNFEGKFCGCGEEYDPEKEKGTMFQCLGLGNIDDGGCGEDWWHPECLMGLPRILPPEVKNEDNKEGLETVKEEAEDGTEQPSTNTEDVGALPNGSSEHAAAEEVPLPTGFPAEDDFDHLVCYKCVNAFPWIKQYAGTPGFLPGVLSKPSQIAAIKTEETPAAPVESIESKKRKADEDAENEPDSNKKAKSDSEAPSDEAARPAVETNGDPIPKHQTLPTATTASISLFAKEDFREHICRCAECFPRLAKHPQLLEEEEAYEPPVSESDHNEDRSAAGRSVHSGSIYDRGEAALSSMDRVRAIEGVMAYNHVRDKVKAFLQPFAESGQAVGAEDIKSYFAKLRGDEAAQREAAMGASSGGAVSGDGRREQDGY